MKEDNRKRDPIGDRMTMKKLARVKKRVVRLVSKIELTFVSTPSLLLDVKALKTK